MRQLGVRLGGVVAIGALGLALGLASWSCAPQISATPLGGTSEAPAVQAKKQQRAPLTQTPQPREAPSKPTETELADTEVAPQAPEGEQVDAGASAEKQAAPGIIFKERGPRVGDVTKSTIRLSARGEIDFNHPGMPPGGDFDVVVSEVTTEEYLAIEGDKVKKLRLHVIEGKTVGKAVGRSMDEPSSLAGSRYLVAVEGRSLKIERDDGRRLSDEDRDELEERYDYLLPEDAQKSPHPDRDFFPDEPMKLGQTIKIPPEVITDFLSMFDRSDADIQITLKALEKVQGIECGRFSVAGRLSAEQSGLSASGQVQGSTHLALDGRYPLKMAVSGSLSFENAPLGISGSAALDLSGAFSVTHP